IIPTYNRARLVPRAVRSALAQTTAEDEVIVADDGSIDNTAEALVEFRDRVRHLRLPHGGEGATRNRGVAHATRPLVAFLDSDDEWLPGKLKLQRAFLERRPDVLFCFSNFRVCLPDGQTLHNFIVQWHRDQRGWDEILG